MNLNFGDKLESILKAKLNMSFPIPYKGLIEMKFEIAKEIGKFGLR